MLDFLEQENYKPTEDPLVFFNEHTEEYVVVCDESSATYVEVHGGRRNQWAFLIAEFIRASQKQFSGGK